MPIIKADDGCPIYVEVEGDDDAPALMLSNSLGTNLHMWDEQAGDFAEHFRLIRYDRRGHGQSGVPAGPYSMERFGKRRDRRARRARDRASTNWCGLSMGGMVGQWLGANAPDRVEKLVLSNTNFYYADKAPWQDRIKFVSRERPRRAGRRQHAALVHRGLPQERAADHGAHEGDVRRHQGAGLYRLLSRRSATWISAAPIRVSPRRPW